MVEDPWLNRSSPALRLMRLQAAFVSECARVGAALKTLQALWIRADFPREPEVLARLIDEALKG